ncbi:hypothetical protein J6836_03490 [Providencia sp. R33]|uniref:hypothetical protein n=1 Tax=Morganellaceae TaxID=1903414 RepID=UPI001C5AA6FB|nr:MULTISPECIES: hypothetical protein [Morganellaceae]QXX83476.1 hypothetical protein J6836_03490 [Providencia sp. R33]WOB92306.1 hypothetical protein P3L44_06925 [Providencia sp. PROV175]
MNDHIVVHTIPNIIQKMKNEGIACTEDSIIGIWKNHHIEFVLDWRGKGYSNTTGRKNYDEIVYPNRNNILYILEYGLKSSDEMITEILVTPYSSKQTEIASLERTHPLYGNCVNFNLLDELSVEDKYLKIIKKSLKNLKIVPHGNKKRFEQEKENFLIKAKHVLTFHTEKCKGVRGKITQEKVAEATLSSYCSACPDVLTSSIDTAKKYLRGDSHIMNEIKKLG